MKQNLIILLVIVVIVGGGAFFLQNTNKSNSVTQGKDAMMEQQPTPTSGEGMMKKDTVTAGQYVPFTKGVLDTAKDKKRVLFFYANWCPTCKPADEDFTNNVNNIPQNVVIVRVNYNDSDTDQDEKDLAKKYGITYQHTYVQIDTAGNEVKKWNGGKLEELLENIK